MKTRKEYKLIIAPGFELTFKRFKDARKVQRRNRFVSHKEQCQECLSNKDVYYPIIKMINDEPIGMITAPR